jgi:hypothetical protein
VSHEALLMLAGQRSYASDYVGLAILIAGYILVHTTHPMPRIIAN